MPILQPKLHLSSQELQSLWMNPPGYLWATTLTTATWPSCLESVLYYWHQRPSGDLLLYCNCKDHAKISLWIKQIERKVLNRQHKWTQFRKVKTTCPANCVDINKVLHIIPSAFWREHWLKMSLFLILVRIGAKHGIEGKISESKMWEILKHDWLKSGPVFQATQWFLQGHTTVTPQIPLEDYSFTDGWHKTFYHTTPEKTEKILQ